MSYEQAYSIVGDEPAWVLRDFLDRLPRTHRVAKAALVLLKRKSNATKGHVPLEHK